MTSWPRARGALEKYRAATAESGQAFSRRDLIDVQAAAHAFRQLREAKEGFGTQATAKLAPAAPAIVPGARESATSAPSCGAGLAGAAVGLMDTNLAVWGYRLLKGDMRSSTSRLYSQPDRDKAAAEEHASQEADYRTPSMPRSTNSTAARRPGRRLRPRRDAAQRMALAQQGATAADLARADGLIKQKERLEILFSTAPGAGIERSDG